MQGDGTFADIELASYDLVSLALPQELQHITLTDR